MNGYAKAFFPPAPSYPIVDRLTDGPAVVDLRQMAPLRLFAAQTHQQAPRCPRSVNGVRTFALPLASAPCSLISRPPAASSSSSVPHGSRLNFAVPVLASDHAIPLSLPPGHGRRNPPSPCSSQGAHRPLRPPFTASSGQLSCHLLRPPPSILLPAPSRCGSQISQTGSPPSSLSACSVLPSAASPDLSLLPLAPISTVDFAPRPIPLHTQTSQTSLLPFKPVRLLHAPLAAHPAIAASAPRFLCSSRQPPAALPSTAFL